MARILGNDLDKSIMDVDVNHTQTHKRAHAHEQKRCAAALCIAVHRSVREEAEKLCVRKRNTAALSSGSPLRCQADHRCARGSGAPLLCLAGHRFEEMHAGAITVHGEL